MTRTSPSSVGLDDDFGLFPSDAAWARTQVLDAEATGVGRPGWRLLCADGLRQFLDIHLADPSLLTPRCRPAGQKRSPAFGPAGRQSAFGSRQPAR